MNCLISTVIPHFTNFSSHTARYLRPPTLPTPSYNVLHSSAQRVSQVVMLRPISLISSNWALNYLWEGCSTVCLSFLFWVELIFIWVKYLFVWAGAKQSWSPGGEQQAQVRVSQLPVRLGLVSLAKYWPSHFTPFSMSMNSPKK